MRHLSDILQSLAILEENRKKVLSKVEEDFSPRLEEAKKELFEAYHTTDEIQNFLSRVENCTDPEYYSFDETGFLVSKYSPKFDVKKYPYFQEFLDTGYVGHWNEEENEMEVCHGPAITINFYHDRREYFIYDSDSRKAILDSRPDIEGHPRISENTYISAKIAEYQNEQGVFNDIVEVDRYGGYLRHFDLMEALKSHVENLDDRQKLQEIISAYENQNDEEEA